MSEALSAHVREPIAETRESLFFFVGEVGTDGFVVDTDSNQPVRVIRNNRVRLAERFVELGCPTCLL